MLANQPMKLNITISDVSDGVYDSVIFLEANSFQFKVTALRSSNSAAFLSQYTLYALCTI